MIGLPEADIIANRLGYVYAEQLVGVLEGGGQYDYPVTRTLESIEVVAPPRNPVEQIAKELAIIDDGCEVERTGSHVCCDEVIWLSPEPRCKDCHDTGTIIVESGECLAAPIALSCPHCEAGKTARSL
jgi:hypothetical protein